MLTVLLIIRLLGLWMDADGVLCVTATDSVDVAFPALVVCFRMLGIWTVAAE